MEQYLPEHLISLEILTRLPIKSIIRFKSVSKTWYASLSTPHFAIAHFNATQVLLEYLTHIYVFVQSGSVHHHNILLVDDNLHRVDHHISIPSSTVIHVDHHVIIAGSCNGLLCFAHSFLPYFTIWNPMIINQPSAKFPCPPIFTDYEHINVSWGFGYASSIDDYKVVRLVENTTTTTKQIMVDVFSLKTRKWLPPLILHGYSLASNFSTPGAYVKETMMLCWIMDKVEDGHDTTNCSQEIMGFDLVNERFERIFHSVIKADTYLTRVSFLCTIMGGYLSMCRFTNRGDVSITTVKENGEVEYMGLYRDMNLSSCSSIVGLGTSSGKFFIQLGDCEIGLLDPKSVPKTYTQLLKFEGDQCKSNIINYVPTFISPLQLYA